MARKGDWNGRRRGQTVEKEGGKPGSHQPRATVAREQKIERPIEKDQKRKHEPTQPRVAAGEPEEKDKRRAGAEAMFPTEVECAGSRAVLHNEPQPGHTALEQIGFDHVAELPFLEVFPLNCRVEAHRGFARVEAHSKLDVLHGGVGKSLLVEAANAQECVSTNRPEPCPESRGRAGSTVMDMVV